jgi:branched-chain amino acid transport system permease protein
MKQIFLFTLLGFGSGALIAGEAVALVAFYRGAGVVNLATGAIAMITGYSFWRLTGAQGCAYDCTGPSTHGLDVGTVPALALCLVICVLVGLLFEFAIFRPLRAAPPLAKLIATLGVLLAAAAATQLAFGQSPRNEPSILPATTVGVFGVPIPIDRFILAGIVLSAALALAALYRWTLFGLATRAAAESEFSAMTLGLSPNLLSGINAVIACVVAGMVGVLAAPLITLDTQDLPLLVVPALAAALLAGLTSPVWACVAGLVLGAAESLINLAQVQSWYPQSSGAPAPGVFDIIVFLVIIAAMYWRGDRIPGRGALVERRLPLAPRPERLLVPAVLAVLLGVAALIVFPYDFRQALMNSMIGTIIALSLVVVTGFVGQVSVVQLAISGVSGLLVSHIANDLGIGFPVGLILGAIAATIIGMAVALGGLRSRGVSLAIVTLAGASLIQDLVLANPSFGAGLTGAPVPEPTLLGLDVGNTASFQGLDNNFPSPMLGFVILAAAISLCLLVAHVRRSHLGQQMLAIRANEQSAAGAGINVPVVKVAAFGISGFIAGIAGGLYGYDFGGVSADRFSALSALALIAFAYIGGITMVSGAVFAGILAVQGLGQYAFQKWFGVNGNWANFLAGVTLIANVIFAPAGGAGLQYAKKQRKRARQAAGLPTPNVFQKAWSVVTRQPTLVGVSSGGSIDVAQVPDHASDVTEKVR